MTLFWRYKTAEDLPPGSFKNGKELTGAVITVADGDGFRFYHQPLFSCSGPNVPKNDVQSTTIKVRLAGIDAPEMGHDGQETQSFAIEARDYLRSLVHDETVTIKLHSVDQYGRVVASAYVKRWIFFNKNLSLELVKKGFATIYSARGACYGGIERQLKEAEEYAK